jgi:hypothetical protein
MGFSPSLEVTYHHSPLHLTAIARELPHGAQLRFRLAILMVETTSFFSVFAWYSCKERAYTFSKLNENLTGE